MFRHRAEGVVVRSIDTRLSLGPDGTEERVRVGRIGKLDPVGEGLGVDSSR